MTANAERNTDGSFTDRGHLTLTVGELFVQHINDYDNGKNLLLRYKNILKPLGNLLMLENKTRNLIIKHETFV